MNRNLRDVVVAAVVAGGITSALGGIFIARADDDPALPGVQHCPENSCCPTAMECLYGPPPGPVLSDPDWRDLVAPEPIR